MDFKTGDGLLIPVYQNVSYCDNNASASAEYHKYNRSTNVKRKENLTMKFRTIRKFYDWQEKKEYQKNDIFESSSRVKVDRLIMAGYLDRINLEVNPLDLSQLSIPVEHRKRGRPPLAEHGKVERAVL